MELGLVAFMVVAFIVNEIMHRRERKELYDRIMAGSLETFQAEKQETKPQGRNVIRRTIEELKNQEVG